MATETRNHDAQAVAESRHSALDELYRDERRPALILLGALLIAVLFFALGVMVGRWISNAQVPRPNAQPSSTPQPAPTTVSRTQAAQPAQTSSSSAAASNSLRDFERNYSLLIATFKTPEEAQPLIKRLEEAGYKDVRTSTPRAGERQPKFSVLLGHYTRDEAEQTAARMRSTGDARLRYVRVIQDNSN